MDLVFVPSLLKNRLNIGSNFEFKFSINEQTLISDKEFKLVYDINELIIKALLNKSVITTDRLTTLGRSSVATKLANITPILNETPMGAYNIDIELFKNLKNEEPDIELVKMNNGIIIFLSNNVVYNLLTNIDSYKDIFLKDLFKLVLNNIDNNDNDKLIEIREIFTMCFSAWYRGYEIS